ncbi:hypothetical protein EHJ37_19660 [Vibrio parahaemolyticus]|nr:hypothetical protein [Vibrio parahaemolyticus]
MKTINIEEYEKFEDAIEAGLNVADTNIADPLQSRRVSAYYEAKGMLGDSQYVDLLEDIFETLITENSLSYPPSFQAVISATKNINNAIQNWDSLNALEKMKYGSIPSKKGAALALIDEIKSLKRSDLSAQEMFNYLSLWLALTRIC